MIMKFLKNTFLPVILATFWISISEFIRNEFLVKSFWVDHYESMGLVFPSEPVNGAIWGLWSLLFAIAIYIIAKKFTFWQSTFLSWFVGFVMMWVVIGNLGVLPYGILLLAVPLSIIEALVATFIIKKIPGGKEMKL